MRPRAALQGRWIVLVTLVISILGCSSPAGIGLVGWAGTDHQLKTLLVTESDITMLEFLIVPTATGLRYVQRVEVAREQQCGEHTFTERRAAYATSDAPALLPDAMQGVRAELSAQIVPRPCGQIHASAYTESVDVLTWVTPEVMAVRHTEGGGEDEGGYHETTHAVAIPLQKGASWPVPAEIRAAAEAALGSKSAAAVWVPVRRDGQTWFGAEVWEEGGLESVVTRWLPETPDGLAEPDFGNGPLRPEGAVDWSLGPGMPGIVLRASPAGLEVMDVAEPRVVTLPGSMVMVRWATDQDEDALWRSLKRIAE